MAGNDNFHVLRLKPGDDLKTGIQQFAYAHHIKAGWLITCVGSLTTYNIRFANAREGSFATGHFEILGLNGTVSENGCHLHICIADDTGKTIGGHLLPGCIINTTAEIVIIESYKYIFTREEDGSTPWKELQIKIRNEPNT
jgi:predicted DNA-binding protein with PD1-like motif